MYYQTHRIDQRGAGGSGNGENFINTNIYSEPEYFYQGCDTMFSDKFWNKDAFCVSQSSMESPVGTMKFKTSKILWLEGRGEGLMG